MSALIRAAWGYREFIISSVMNEFKSRFARSRLGTIWVVIQPMVQVTIFATVLSSVLAAKLQGVDNKFGYAAYLMSGICCWSLFAEILQRCTTVFIDNGSLLKKIQFPRIALPIISIISSSINNLALLCVVLVVLPMLGLYPTANYLWLPLLMALTIALATGLGLLLGTLNVFARDVGQFVSVVLQLWFWITPIVYPLNILPDAFKSMLDFNPVMPLVTGYHNVLVYGTAPSLSGLLSTSAVAVVLLLLAGFIFRRASAEMVDVL